MVTILLIINIVLLSYLSWNLTKEPKEVIKYAYEKLDPILVARAKELILSYKDNTESGEWKRHQVYAQLMKDFPEEEKCDLAYLIEEVIQSIKYEM